MQAVAARKGRMLHQCVPITDDRLVVTSPPPTPSSTNLQQACRQLFQVFQDGMHTHLMFFMASAIMSCSV
jgi:hypothetical protein